MNTKLHVILVVHNDRCWWSVPLVTYYINCIVWRVCEGQSEQATRIHGLSSTSRCHLPPWDSSWHHLWPTPIEEYSANDHHAVVATSGKGACDPAHGESEGGGTSPANWEHGVLPETCSWGPHKRDRQASSERWQRLPLPTVIYMSICAPHTCTLIVQMWDCVLSSHDMTVHV